jgi:GntR family transcriptional regulator
LANLQVDTVLVESELVNELSASRNTVRAVLQQLAAEGLICRGPKIGTHAVSAVVIPVDKLTPLSELRGRDKMHTGLLETTVIRPPSLIAERLELDGTQSVRVIEAIILDGATPIALAVHYVAVPPESSATPASGLPHSAITLLEEHLHTVVTKADTVVFALACDAWTGRILCVPAGSPILFVEDVLRTDDDRPAALSQYRFRSNGVSLTATAWRVRGASSEAEQPGRRR